MSRYPSKEKPAPTKRAGWRVKEWSEQVGLCRATVYKLADRAEITMVRVGSAAIITTDPAEYLASKIGDPGTSRVAERTEAHRARLKERWAGKGQPAAPDAA